MLWAQEVSIAWGIEGLNRWHNRANFSKTVQQAIQDHKELTILAAIGV